MADEAPVEAPPSTGRRRWRWVRRALLGVVALVLGLLLALHLPPVQEWLVSTALEGFRARQALDLTWTEIRYNLITRSATISGLRVGAEGAPAPLVVAEQAVVRFPFSLYRGRLDGLDVTLQNATVTLVRERGAWTTIPPAWTRSTPGAPPRRLPAFSALRLHGVNVTYDDRDTRFRADTTGLRVDLLPTGSALSGDLAGDLASGARTIVRWEPRGTTLTVRGGRARFSPEGAGVDRLLLDAPEGRVASDVRFAFRGDDRFGLTARANLRADQLDGWVQALDTARGDLGVEITMPAAGGAPAFADVRFASPEFIWRGLTFTDVRGEGPLATGAVTLSSASMRLGPGRIEGTAHLAWTADAESRATVTGRDVDVAATLRTLVPDTPAVARFAPGALVSGTFTGQWRGWRSATLDGVLDTTWRPRSLARPERYGLTGRIRTRFARGLWAVDMQTRVDDALDVTGPWTLRASEADFARWPIAGTLALDGGTPGTLTTAMRLFEFDPPVDLAEASGTIGGTVTLAGALGTPEATTTLEGTLAWPDQPAIDARAEAVITAGAIHLTAFDAASGPSRATAALTIDLNRDTIDGRFTGTAVPMESWLRRFDLSAPVSGPVEVTGTLSGPLARIQVEADVTGGPVLVAGQAFDRLSSHVLYDGRAVRATDLTLGRGDGTIAGRLAWTRDGDALDGAFEMTAVPFETRLPGVVLSDGAIGGLLRAVAGGRATLGGTARQPRVDLSIAAPDLTLDARRFGPVTIEARTETGALTRVSATARDLGATLNGTVDLSGTRAFDLAARIDTDNSPFALSTYGVSVELGAIALDARATGVLDGPSLDTLDLTVRRLDGAVVGISREVSATTVGVNADAGPPGAPLLPFAIEPGSAMRYRDEVVTVERAALTTGQTRVAAQGTLGTPDETLTLDLAGRLDDLRPLALALAPASVTDPVLEGPVRARLVASGTLDRPAVKGSFDVDGARIGDGLLPPLTDTWVRVVLDGEQIRLDLVEAHWQGAHMAFSGTVPTWFARLPGSSRTRAGASITGHIDDVTLKVLEPFVAPEALQATSFQSRLTFQLAATEPSLRAVTADAVIGQMVLRSRELGLAQRAPAKLRLEQGVLRLESWTLGAPWSRRTSLTLGGALTLPDGDSPAGLDFGVDGTVDLRAAGLLLGGYHPAGSAAIHARVTGPATAPSIDGLVRITDGALLIRDPRLILENVNGGLRFSNDRLAVEEMSGVLNGGALAVGGSMRQPGRGEPDGALTIIARGVLLEAPRGLRSAIDADLTFAERRNNRFALTGTVTIAEAAYRETMLVTGGIMSLLRPPEDAIEVPETEGPGANWLTLDLRVVADDSIAIDTAYGRFNVGANLRVQGRPAAPRINGSAAIAPGGVLYVGGRTYQVESGVVQFRGSATTRPDIRFNARTSVGGYDITLDVQTRGDVTETTLQSDPPLPEEDIASLLLSGQKSADVDAADAVTEQLVATLSGELVGAVGRAIGLDSVRVEQANPGDILFDASLISSDASPAQRLTFSKRVFPDLEVVVSQSLRESGDITWILSWQPLLGVELRFVQLDDEDKSYEIRHDLSFGGGVKRKARVRRRREDVRTVSVSAAGGITEADVRSALTLTEGDRFDFYDWQGDRDRLEQWLVDNRYYEGRVIARRDPATPPPLEAADRSPVDLRYTVRTGPRTEIVIAGADVPDHVRRELVAAWVDVPIDSLLSEEFSARLRPWLAEQGYLQSEIDVAIERSRQQDADAQTAVKTATVTIETGPRYTERVVVYTGNEGLTARDLDEAIADAGLGDRVFAQPADARAVVLAAYRRNGFLSAQAVVGDLRFDGARAELPIRVVEGPRFRAGSVTIKGADAAPDVTAPIETGTVLTDRLVADAVRELARRYRRAGYRARVRADTATRADGGTVDLVFTAVLGQPSRIEEIRIAGATGVSQRVIDRTLDLQPGEPLSPEALSRAREKLYDTGVFRTVAIDTEPIRRPGDGAPAEGRPRAATGQVRATVTVEELPRYRFRYGFQLYDPASPLFDPKWGKVDPGVVADLTRRGLFGRGVTGGIGMRLNPSEETVRGYLSTRTFFGLPAQTNLVVGGEDTKTSSAGFVLHSRAQSIAFDQRLRWRRLLQVGYGYSFEQRTFDVLVSPGPLLPGLFPVEYEANIGRLLGNVVFDERDNVLDTRQGPFHSSSIEYAPTALGSTRAFYKYLGQQFYFVPWKRVTFGAAARIELSGGPGRGLVPTERLRVGGGNTVRGYEDDTLSLRDIVGAAEGRTGIVVVNQETRFPLGWRLQGAAFWDYAHIYGDTGDFLGLRVRNSVGGGIRVLLPFIILRVDYGYPLNQDERNDKGRFYFAIGHAF